MPTIVPKLCRDLAGAWLSVVKEANLSLLAKTSVLLLPALNAVQDLIPKGYSREIPKGRCSEPAAGTHFALYLVV